MRYEHVICGGTFDHLHNGHKKLLNVCFKEGKKVTVGITSGAMLRHKPYIHSLQSYSQRKKQVLQFATQNKKDISIVKIKDLYGPTLKNSSFQAIYVTKDTLSGGYLINKERTQIGLKPLTIHIVEFALDENNDKISSENIRRGILTGEGKRYDSFLISKEIRILPESLKAVLRKPLGRVISSFSSLSREQRDRIRQLPILQGGLYMCAIGDMVTLGLKRMKVGSFLSLIDGQTKRKALNESLFHMILEKERYSAINKKGTVSKDACIAIQNLFSIGHQRAINQIYIEGEEDLLALPVILTAPLDSHVWYGIKGKGVVCVKVSEKKKEKVYNLLKRFE